MAVVALVKPWDGTVLELLADLEKHMLPERRGRSWPKSPQSLTSKMRRAAPALRREGIAIAQPPRSKRGALWTIRVVGDLAESSSPSAPIDKPDSLSMVGDDDHEGQPSFPDAEPDGSVTNVVDGTPRQTKFVTFPAPPGDRSDVEGSERDEHCFLLGLGKRGHEPPPSPNARETGLSAAGDKRSGR
jgi:hypothetical protein